MASISAKGRQPYAAEKIKQLYIIAEDNRPGTELVPFVCIEARIDFNDVRTGFRETVSLTKALEIYSETADLLWTEDMIRDVNPMRTVPAAPSGVQVGVLPGFVDANFFTRMENQFVQYLLRSFEVRIYRNFDLNLYSFSGESQEDFRRRCLELFDGQRRSELDTLHEVFERRLEQAKQKYLAVGDTAGLEQAKTESRNRDWFSRCAERISELFYNAEFSVNAAAGQPEYAAGMLELDEKLLSIESEAHHEIAALYDRYNEKARAVDEYILHPNLKDIHFVRSCILWMPKGAA